MKRLVCLLLILLILSAAACFAEGIQPETVPADGVYSARFTTDSSMFRVNETCDGRGTLTVRNGEMTIHVSLMSKKIVNLYPGLAEDARREGAVLLEPTIDSVTYPDGITEEVYGFDIPVSAVGTEFDLALIGTKGKWYDHKVMVSDPVPVEETEAAGTEENGAVPGDYTFTWSGGSGRVDITCPGIRVTPEGTTAVLVFSSPHYEYVKVDGETYPTTCDDSSSTAEIPAQLNRAFEILACTTAMSTPHEICYTLYIRTKDAGEDGIPGLAWESDLPLQYAEGFSVSFYQDGYTLITVREEGRWLLVPEGKPVPDGLDPEIRVISKLPERIYLAATSAMSLFDALDALKVIRFSSLRQEDWTIPGAAEAMERGDILFAGKYDTPDYESLVREDCDLAVESTMITHAPKVRELLEALGIPVFVDRSGYETHPLGRTEWIRLYGVLTGRQAEADDFFDEQAGALQQYGDTGLSVAFFYINTRGEAVVREPSDYIPGMIAMAGGRSATQEVRGEGQGHVSVSLSMEDFYNMAGEADYLIYNGAIDTSVRSLEDLTARNGLLGEFRAVKEGRVWLAGKDLNQATGHVSAFITDVHRMLTGEDGEMVFLARMK